MKRLLIGGAVLLLADTLYLFTWDILNTDKNWGKPLQRPR